MNGKETKTEERLGNISKKLEDISNTIKEVFAKPKELDKNECPIINLVDNEFERRLGHIYLSRNLDRRFYSKFFLLGFFFAVYFLVAFILSKIIQAVPFTLSSSTPSQTLTLFLSITTAFVALVSFSFGTMFNLKTENISEIQQNYNYNVLKKKVKPEECPTLKALIILKSRQPDFLLSKFYSNDKQLNNEEILKILYTIDPRF
jgi:hypothetical protein